MRIAIASGKGGTGKTTLAVNLALALAERQSTLLIDLDVEEPNSALFLKGSQIEARDMTRSVPEWDQQSCTLCGSCTAWCRYNALLKLGDTILVLPELCHSCHACAELCPVSALPMRELPLGRLKRKKKGNLEYWDCRLEIGVEQASPLIGKCLALADALEAEPALQILDCPPGTACAMVSAVKTADHVILVTEPTQFGLHDLKLAVQTARHLSKPVSVIVNRSTSSEDMISDYCRSEGIPLWARIPELRQVAELYSNAEPIWGRIPEFDTALRAVIKQVEELG